jgi:two-component system response regulator YesN
MYRIILVDDEHIVLKGVKVLLERMDVSAEIIATVQDGKTAYQLIQEMKPDIVITDIRIPFIDGLSLIEMCKETLPNIHYIVISGYQDF